MKAKKQQYRTREERNQFIVKMFSSYLSTSVLNVGGGGERYLAKYLNKEVKYYEIDIAGKPDLIFDLEKDNLEIFKTNQFDTVVCTDVLEHVDDFHNVFNHLLRISNKNVIISLPNSYQSILETLSSQNSMKFYGLPLKKPEDRHKWFFSATDIESFFINSSLIYNYKIKSLIHLGLYHDRGIIKNTIYFILKLILSKKQYKNLRTQTVWVHLTVNN